MAAKAVSFLVLALLLLAVATFPVVSSRAPRPLPLGHFPCRARCAFVTWRRLLVTN